MLYTDKALERYMLAPLGMSKQSKRKLLQDTMNALYGEIEIPRERVNWAEKRVPNGGLLDKPFIN